MVIDFSTLLTELMVLTVAPLVQAWLAATLKRIEEDTDLSTVLKSHMALDLIEKVIEKVFSTESRLFFHQTGSLVSKL